MDKLENVKHMHWPGVILDYNRITLCYVALAHIICLPKKKFFLGGKTIFTHIRIMLFVYINDILLLYIEHA